jgi:hypothetical protein
MLSDKLSIANLELLLDKEAIRDVLHRYCRGIDRRELPYLREVYFEDATEDHGDYRGSGKGFVDRPSTIDPRLEMVHHSLGQIMIDMKGSVALCETYFVCGLIYRPVSEEPYFADLRGRYLDRLEKRNGDWKISQRVAVLDLTQQFPLHEWGRASAFVRGGHWPDDLVFHPELLSARVTAAIRAKEKS